MTVRWFDKLPVGFLLVLVTLFLVTVTPLGSLAFILLAVYIIRYTGSQQQVFFLGIAASLGIIAVYFLSGILYYDTSSTHALLASTIIWVSVYGNIRAQRVSSEKLKLDNTIRLLSEKTNDTITQIEEIKMKLTQATDDRVKVEQELLKRKKLQDAMAHNFPDGVICVLNTDMKFVLADGGEIEELGLGKNTKKSETASLNLTAIPEIKRAFNGEQVVTEIKLNNKSYTLNGVPIADANNQITEVLVVIRNITDQKNLENNLIKALEREKELNVLKSQFVTMASHKFRTPLSTILSSVFLLENYTDADYELEKTAFFDKIKRSVHNLTALLNDYLSLGKLEEGKLKVTYTETDMKLFFDEFLQEIGSIKKVKQKIHFTHDGLACTVMTDKFLLKNILTNLLSNAIEYSPHDAEIQLSAELKKDMLKIKVTDQGIGIPENEQHQIFKRFYRGQNAHNVEGTGLGLNIAKKYIRLLKGTIEFTSQLNKGTTFIAIIPVMNVNVLEKQA